MVARDKTEYITVDEYKSIQQRRSKTSAQGKTKVTEGDIMQEKELHEKERRLLEFIRRLGYGELVIKVQDGLPVMIEKATEKVKL